VVKWLYRITTERSDIDNVVEYMWNVEMGYYMGKFDCNIFNLIVTFRLLQYKFYVTSEVVI
jgi:hypothetical protein